MKRKTNLGMLYNYLKNKVLSKDFCIHKIYKRRKLTLRNKLINLFAFKRSGAFRHMEEKYIKSFHDKYVLIPKKLRIAGLSLIFFLVINLLANISVKAFMEDKIEVIFGANVTVDSLDIEYITGDVYLNGFELGYGDSNSITIDSVKLDLDLFNIFNKEIGLKSLDINRPIVNSTLAYDENLIQKLIFNFYKYQISLDQHLPNAEEEVADGGIVFDFENAIASINNYETNFKFDETSRFSIHDGQLKIKYANSRLEGVNRFSIKGLSGYIYNDVDIDLNTSPFSLAKFNLRTIDFTFDFENKDDVNALVNFVKDGLFRFDETLALKIDLLNQQYGDKLPFKLPKLSKLARSEFPYNLHPDVEELLSSNYLVFNNEVTLDEKIISLKINNVIEHKDLGSFLGELGAFVDYNFVEEKIALKSVDIDIDSQSFVKSDKFGFNITASTNNDYVKLAMNLDFLDNMNEQHLLSFKGGINNVLEDIRIDNFSLKNSDRDIILSGNIFNKEILSTDLYIYYNKKDSLFPQTNIALNVDFDNKNSTVKVNNIGIKSNKYNIKLNGEIFYLGEKIIIGLNSYNWGSKTAGIYLDAIIGEENIVLNEFKIKSHFMNSLIKGKVSGDDFVVNGDFYFDPRKINEFLAYVFNVNIKQTPLYAIFDGDFNLKKEGTSIKVAFDGEQVLSSENIMENNPFLILKPELANKLLNTEFDYKLNVNTAFNILLDEKAKGLSIERFDIKGPLFDGTIKGSISNNNLSTNGELQFIINDTLIARTVLDSIVEGDELIINNFEFLFPAIKLAISGNIDDITDDLQVNISGDLKLEPNNLNGFMAYLGFDLPDMRDIMPYFNSKIAVNTDAGLLGKKFIISTDGELGFNITNILRYAANNGLINDIEAIPSFVADAADGVFNVQSKIAFDDKGNIDVDKLNIVNDNTNLAISGVLNKFIDEKGSINLKILKDDNKFLNLSTNLAYFKDAGSIDIRRLKFRSDILNLSLNGEGNLNALNNDYYNVNSKFDVNITNLSNMLSRFGIALDTTNFSDYEDIKMKGNVNLFAEGETDNFNGSIALDTRNLINDDFIAMYPWIKFIKDTNSDVNEATKLEFEIANDKASKEANYFVSLNDNKAEGKLLNMFAKNMSVTGTVIVPELLEEGIVYDIAGSFDTELNMMKIAQANLSTDYGDVYVAGDLYLDENKMYNSKISGNFTSDYLENTLDIDFAVEPYSLDETYQTKLTINGGGMMGEDLEKQIITKYPQIASFIDDNEYDVNFNVLYDEDDVAFLCETCELDINQETYKLDLYAKLDPHASFTLKTPDGLTVKGNIDISEIVLPVFKKAAEVEVEVEVEVEEVAEEVEEVAEEKFTLISLQLEIIGNTGEKIVVDVEGAFDSENKLFNKYDGSEGVEISIGIKEDNCDSGVRCAAEEKKEIVNMVLDKELAVEDFRFTELNLKTLNILDKVLPKEITEEIMPVSIGQLNKIAEAAGLDISANIFAKFKGEEKDGIKYMQAFLLEKYAVYIKQGEIDMEVALIRESVPDTFNTEIIDQKMLSLSNLSVLNGNQVMYFKGQMKENVTVIDKLLVNAPGIEAKMLKGVIKSEGKPDEYSFEKLSLDLSHEEEGIISGLVLAKVPSLEKKSLELEASLNDGRFEIAKLELINEKNKEMLSISNQKVVLSGDTINIGGLNLNIFNEEVKFDNGLIEYSTILNQSIIAFKSITGEFGGETFNINGSIDTGRQGHNFKGFTIEIGDEEILSINGTIDVGRKFSYNFTTKINTSSLEGLYVSSDLKKRIKLIPSVDVSVSVTTNEGDVCGDIDGSFEEKLIDTLICWNIDKHSVTLSDSKFAEFALDVSSNKRNLELISRLNAELICSIRGFELDFDKETMTGGLDMDSIICPEFGFELSSIHFKAGAETGENESIKIEGSIDNNAIKFDNGILSADYRDFKVKENIIDIIAFQYDSITGEGDGDFKLYNKDKESIVDLGLILSNGGEGIQTLRLDPVIYNDGVRVDLGDITFDVQTEEVETDREIKKVTSILNFINNLKLVNQGDDKLIEIANNTEACTTTKCSLDVSIGIGLLKVVFTSDLLSDKLKETYLLPILTSWTIQEQIKLTTGQEASDQLLAKFKIDFDTKETINNLTQNTIMNGNNFSIHNVIGFQTGLNGLSINFNTEGETSNTVFNLLDTEDPLTHMSVPLDNLIKVNNLDFSVSLIETKMPAQTDLLTSFRNIKYKIISFFKGRDVFASDAAKKLIDIGFSGEINTDKVGNQVVKVGHFNIGGASVVNAAELAIEEETGNISGDFRLLGEEQCSVVETVVKDDAGTDDEIVSKSYDLSCAKKGEGEEDSEYFGLNFGKANKILDGLGMGDKKNAILDQIYFKGLDTRVTLIELKNADNIIKLEEFTTQIKIVGDDCKGEICPIGLLSSIKAVIPNLGEIFVTDISIEGEMTGDDNYSIDLCVSEEEGGLCNLNINGYANKTAIQLEIEAQDQKILEFSGNGIPTDSENKTLAVNGFDRTIVTAQAQKIDDDLKFDLTVYSGDLAVYLEKLGKVVLAVDGIDKTYKPIEKIINIGKFKTFIAFITGEINIANSSEGNIPDGITEFVDNKIHEINSKRAENEMVELSNNNLWINVNFSEKATRYFSLFTDPISLQSYKGIWRFEFIVFGIKNKASGVGNTPLYGGYVSAQQDKPLEEDANIFDKALVNLPVDDDFDDLEVVSEGVKDLQKGILKPEKYLITPFVAVTENEVVSDYFKININHYACKSNGQTLMSFESDCVFNPDLLRNSSLIIEYDDGQEEETVSYFSSNKVLASSCGTTRWSSTGDGLMVPELEGEEDGNNKVELTLELPTALINYDIEKSPACIIDGEIKYELIVGDRVVVDVYKPSVEVSELEVKNERLDFNISNGAVNGHWDFVMRNGALGITNIEIGLDASKFIQDEKEFPGIKFLVENYKEPIRLEINTLQESDFQNLAIFQGLTKTQIPDDDQGFLYGEDYVEIENEFKSVEMEISQNIVDLLITRIILDQFEIKYFVGEDLVLTGEASITPPRVHLEKDGQTIFDLDFEFQNKIVCDSTQEVCFIDVYNDKTRISDDSIVCEGDICLQSCMKVFSDSEVIRKTTYFKDYNECINKFKFLSMGDLPMPYIQPKHFYLPLKMRTLNLALESKVFDDFMITYGPSVEGLIFSITNFTLADVKDMLEVVAQMIGDLEIEATVLNSMNKFLALSEFVVSNDIEVKTLSLSEFLADLGVRAEVLPKNTFEWVLNHNFDFSLIYTTELYGDNQKLRLRTDLIDEGEGGKMIVEVGGSEAVVKLKPNLLDDQMDYDIVVHDKLGELTYSADGSYSKDDDSIPIMNFEDNLGNLIELYTKEINLGGMECKDEHGCKLELQNVSIINYLLEVIVDFNLRLAKRVIEFEVLNEGGSFEQCIENFNKSGFYDNLNEFENGLENIINGDAISSSSKTAIQNINISNAVMGGMMNFGSEVERVLRTVDATVDPMICNLSTLFASSADPIEMGGSPSFGASNLDNDIVIGLEDKEKDEGSLLSSLSLAVTNMKDEVKSVFVTEKVSALEGSSPVVEPSSVGLTGLTPAVTDIDFENMEFMRAVIRMSKDTFDGNFQVDDFFKLFNECLLEGDTTSVPSRMCRILYDNIWLRNLHFKYSVWGEYTPEEIDITDDFVFDSSYKTANILKYIWDGFFNSEGEGVIKKILAAQVDKTKEELNYIFTEYGLSDFQFVCPTPKELKIREPFGICLVTKGNRDGLVNYHETYSGNETDSGNEYKVYFIDGDKEPSINMHMIYTYETPQKSFFSLVKEYTQADAYKLWILTYYEVRNDKQGIIQNLPSTRDIYNKYYETGTYVIQLDDIRDLHTIEKTYFRLFPSMPANQSSVSEETGVLETLMMDDVTKFGISVLKAKCLIAANDEAGLYKQEIFEQCLQSEFWYSMLGFMNGGAENGDECPFSSDLICDDLVACDSVATSDEPISECIDIISNYCSGGGSDDPGCSFLYDSEDEADSHNGEECPLSWYGNGVCDYMCDPPDSECEDNDEMNQGECSFSNANICNNVACASVATGGDPTQECTNIISNYCSGGGSDDPGCSFLYDSEDEADSHNGEECPLSWYGDGVCDYMCDPPDPECEDNDEMNQEDPQALEGQTGEECPLSWHSNGVCDLMCDPPDPECEDNDEMNQGECPFSSDSICNGSACASVVAGGEPTQECIDMVVGYCLGDGSDDPGCIFPMIQDILNSMADPATD